VEFGGISSNSPIDNLSHKSKIYLENETEGFINSILFDSDMLHNDNDIDSPTLEATSLLYVVEVLTKRITQYK